MKCNIDSKQAQLIAQDIQLLLLDVDGVLTDGHLYYSNSGEEMKTFSTLDGHGIKMLQENGIRVGIITGRSSQLLVNRARELGIEILLQGQTNKIDALQQILQQTDASPQAVAYAGDDFPDLQVMRSVGLGISVANGHPDIIASADLVTSRRGGDGAVREITDFLLKAQDKYSAYLK